MSIIDVARQAGVSVSTVSRVINHQTGVSRDTEDRIRLVMEDIGYVPPVPERRRGPKSGHGNSLQGGVLLLLLSRQSTMALEGSFLLTKLQAGLQEGAAEHGCLVCVGTVPAESSPALPCCNGSLQAAFVLDPSIASGRIAALGAVPTIYLMAPPMCNGSECDVVGTDNAAIGRMAAEHLLASGHTRLAVINPFCCWDEAAWRVASFVAAGRRGGALVHVFDNTTHDAEWADPAVHYLLRRPVACRALAQLYAQCNPRPTGIFVVGDLETAIVQRSLLAAGVSVGEDVQIVSCNNDQAALGGLDPKPLTFDLSAYEVGRQAVELAVARCSGHLRSPAVNIAVSPKAIPPQS